MREFGNEPGTEDAIRRLLGAATGNPDLVTTTTDLITSRARTRLPVLSSSADEDFWQATATGCASTLRSAWHALLAGEPIANAAPPPETVRWTTQLVHRGIDLSILLRIYQIGQAAVLEVCEHVASEIGPGDGTQGRVIGAVARYTSAYVDAVCEQLTEQYVNERAHWQAGTAARRAELTRALLDGWRPTSAAPTSAALGYDLTRRHLACILWTESNSPVPEDAAATLARRLSADRVLTVPVSDQMRWAWVSGERIEVSVDSMERIEGCRVAAGQLERGIEGFVQSHRQAAAARRVATTLAPYDRFGVVSYTQTALISLLIRDLDAATSFTALELGGLAENDDGTARLRSTLCAYFEEGQNLARTARRLDVHHNTISYRLHKAEELLGHPVQNRRLELEVALHLSGLLQSE
ncbi:PucR family transcriptional regulator [Amycolatopsis anabasis]|uniref:PucR family transcriptional regulator n=1 Tax=Amycolatopsis anabasis TaxID=1840409 RepID=UPI00131D1AB2|nr:PucR family transcriptional regulator [Amycolatopsis anabasis]